MGQSEDERLERYMAQCEAEHGVDDPDGRPAGLGYINGVNFDSDSETGSQESDLGSDEEVFRHACFLSQFPLFWCPKSPRLGSNFSLFRQQ